MLLTPSQSSLSRYTELLTKITNYLLGIALLCYLTGFAITNMYLGSLGIVNLDILRARYILAGLLFLLFVSAILYLTYGLIRTLHSNRHLSALGIIRKAVGYSARYIAMLYVIIPAIAIFSGIKNSPLGIPQVSRSAPWSSWLVTEPLLALQRAFLIEGGMLFAIILVFAFVISINPKNKYGVKKARKQILAEIIETIKKQKGKIIGILLGICVMVFVLFLITSILNFIIAYQPGSSSTIGTSLPDGWWQFFGAITAIYLFIAVFLTIPSPKFRQ